MRQIEREKRSRKGEGCGDEDKRRKDRVHFIGFVVERRMMMMGTVIVF